ncbi:hypothetical protein C3L33_02040, partial [Rhododendron williamsianum]
MACSSGSCESGCYKDNNEAEAAEEENQHSLKNEPPNGVPTGNNGVNRHNLCIKCKSNETIAATNPTPAAFAAGCDGGRFCAECFRSNLFGKFKFAVTSNAMISPSDNVLVAFSGGTSSRVALQFVHEMQCKAQKNFDASRDRSLPVFSVGVAFVDESAIYPVSSQQLDDAIEDINLLGGEGQVERVSKCFSDVTGKEDLMLHLRMLSLQKIALENGYTKLLLGSCTSRIACHVITATVKGQGYSLAADIQYVDARWGVPVVLPLRDCLTQELSMLCCLDRYLKSEIAAGRAGWLKYGQAGSLKTVEVLDTPRSGINGLVSSFVKLLQDARSDDLNCNLASLRRQKKYNLKLNESLPPESFCPICNSPLSKSDLLSLNDVENGQLSAETFGAKCCLSCLFQILPKERSSLEHFYSFLPQPIIAQAKNDNHCNRRWLR